MNSKRVGLRLKGFTLVEMIVVIAIIATLAGIVSLAMNAYRRDAIIETNNNKAQLVYTGIQNQLIQCEIKQDDSIFDIDKKGNSDKIKYVELAFSMTVNKISDDIYVKTTYTAGGEKNKVVSATTDSLEADESFKHYKKLTEAIKANVDSTFEGIVKVYIDYENYLVDSVIYLENMRSIGAGDFGGLTTDVNFEVAPIKDYIKKYGNYHSIYSVKNQEEMADKAGIYCGVYPLYNEIS